MGFEKFGKVSYVSETKVAKFVDFLEEGKLATTKCKKCGKAFFPPRANCDSCLSDDVEWVELSGNCTLITYTTVRFAPPLFRWDCPYVLAVAQLDEGPTAFAALSKEISEGEIKIGMRLKLTPVRLIGDRITYELRKHEIT